jgi:iron complex transport system permease protein
LLIVASIITSVAVAYTGIIAFVGLVVPHVVRIILGPDHRVLLPLAFLTGSIFMLIADTLARTLVSPAELRVGMVTALAGAPFFIFLLIKRRQQIFSL